MKILITGGNGFIARSLKEAILDEEVVCCSRQELDLLDAPSIFQYLNKHQFDVVIHAATYDAAPACSTKDPKMVLENNLRMFFNIARCQDYFGKMIYFGSGAEFNREHWKPRMNEDYFDQYVPQDPYGFSKYVMTKYALASDNIYNLRLFGLYGKYDDWRYRFIPSTCVKAIFNRPIIINENKLMDFLYIDDLTKIVKWFLSHKPLHQVYNICTGQGVELKRIAQDIIRMAKKELKIVIKEDKPIIEYSGNNSLLLSEIIDLKFSSLKESIAELYLWYSSHRATLDILQVL